MISQMKGKGASEGLRTWPQMTQQSLDHDNGCPAPSLKDPTFKCKLKDSTIQIIGQGSGREGEVW